MTQIPPRLASNVAEAFGVDGVRWLARLPDLLAEVATNWQLEVGPPYELSFHWVAPVRRHDGTAAVLKLGPPRAEHLREEAASLQAYAGNGAVCLLEHDDERGALLLERAEPGTMARELVPHKDLIATAAIITVMHRLHQAPVPTRGVQRLTERDAPSFDDHLRRYAGDEPIPRRLVERAAELHRDLSASATTTVLLHGDLHHDNVLRARRQPWLAIDPHGVLGDPGYDTGAVLYNPDPDNRDPGRLDWVPPRIEQLADGLGLALERVVAWGFVQAVLSEVWTAETVGAPVTRALDVALLLEKSL